MRQQKFAIPVIATILVAPIIFDAGQSRAANNSAQTGCATLIQGININANAPIGTGLLAELRRSLPKNCPTTSYFRTVSSVFEAAVSRTGGSLVALDVMQASDQFLRVEFQVTEGGDEEFSSAVILADELPYEAIIDVEIMGDAVEEEILTFRYILGGAAAVDSTMRLGLNWLRNGEPIAGATNSRYRLSKQDIGSQISGRLTLYGADQSIVEQREQALAVTIAAAEYPPQIRDLTIVGKAETGTELTAKYTFRDDNPDDVEGASEFIWLRDNYAIKGANGSTYVPTTQDIDKNIGVRVVPKSSDGVAGAARTFVMREPVAAKPVTVDPALLDQTPSIIVEGGAPSLPIPRPARPEASQESAGAATSDENLTGEEVQQLIIKSLESAAAKVQKPKEGEAKQEEPLVPQAPRILRPDIMLAEGLSLDPNETTRLTRIAFSPTTIFDDTMLAALSAPYIGQEISVDLIRQIIDAVGARYLEQGYELSRALLPEQRVSGGVLSLRLVEARIGKIVLEEKDRLSPKFIFNFLDIGEGSLLSLSNLERRIRLFNSTNKSNITSELAPGAEFGETDIFLTVQEPDLVELPTVSINNYASEVTDWRQQSFSVTFNNLLRRDDELFVAYNDSNGSESASFNLGMPIGNEGLNLSVGHSESNTRYTSDGSGAAGIIGTRGASHSNNFSMSMPLIFEDEYSVYVSAAYGSSYSEVTLANSSVNLNESRVRKLEVALPMNYGNAVSNFSVSPSFAVLNSSTFSASFDSRNEKWMGAAKANISASRYLNKRATLNLRSNIVYSEATDLLNYPSELLTVGGPGSVRAYQPSVSSGHQGYFASLELRSDLANWEQVTLPASLPYVQPYAFLDHAFAQSRQRKTQRDNFWSGAGVGVSIPTFAKFFSFDAYWATPLDSSSHKTQRDAYKDELFQFSLSAKFRLP